MFVLVATPITIVLVLIAVGAICLRYRQHQQFKASVAALLASHDAFRESLDAFDSKLISSSRAGTPEQHRVQTEGQVFVAFAGEQAFAMLREYLEDYNRLSDRYHAESRTDYHTPDEEMNFDVDLMFAVLKEPAMVQDYPSTPRDLVWIDDDQYCDTQEYSVSHYAVAR